jgi:hypothetical protein
MYSRLSGTLVYGATDISKTFSFVAPNVNAEATVLVVDVPNFTNSVTLTIRYKSDGAKLMKSVASISKNAPYPIELRLPFIEGCEIMGTLSGQPGGSGGTINLYLYIAGE